MMRTETIREIAVDIMVDVTQHVIDTIDPLKMAEIEGGQRNFSEEEVLELADLLDRANIELEVSWDD